MKPRPPPRAVGRGWLADPVFLIGVTAIVVSAIWASVTLVPIEHRVSESFTLWGTGPAGCGTSTNFTLPSSGGFTFSWDSNTSNSGGLTLYEVAPNVPEPAFVWGQIGLNGSGNASIDPGLDYYFAFCGEWNQTASINGVLTFDAPLLWRLYAPPNQ